MGKDGDGDGDTRRDGAGMGSISWGWDGNKVTVMGWGWGQNNLPCHSSANQHWGIVSIIICLYSGTAFEFSELPGGQERVVGKPDYGKLPSSQQARQDTE